MARAQVWLFIDTHAPGKSRFAWLEEGKPVRPVELDGRASVVLPRIAKTWKKKIGGVCAVAGPGSFSSVRAGVLQANLISRLLKIPLVGVDVHEADDLPVLAARLYAGHIPSSGYVAPVYDQEPNITLPKTA